MTPEIFINRIGNLPVKAINRIDRIIDGKTLPQHKVLSIIDRLADRMIGAIDGKAQSKAETKREEVKSPAPASTEPAKEVGIERFIDKIGDLPVKAINKLDKFLDKKIQNPEDGKVLKAVDKFADKALIGTIDNPSKLLNPFRKFVGMIKGFFKAEKPKIEESPAVKIPDFIPPENRKRYWDKKIIEKTNRKFLPEFDMLESDILTRISSEEKITDSEEVAYAKKFPFFWATKMLNYGYLRHQEAAKTEEAFKAFQKMDANKITEDEKLKFYGEMEKSIIREFRPQVWKDLYLKIQGEVQAASVRQ